MLQRFLLLWLMLLSLVAFLWPQIWSVAPEFVVAWFGTSFDPFVETWDRGYLKPIFRVTMFSIGCLLPRDEIAQVLRKWPTVFGGTAIQYVSMPLLAFAIVNTFQLSSSEIIGVMMVGCVPGAMASNVLTLAARGNVSYSVSLTTSATLVSPLAVPLVLWLTLGSRVELDPIKTSLNLLTLVVGPVMLGHLLCRGFARFAAVMQGYCPMVANLTILWIIAAVVGADRDSLSEITLTLLAALLTVNVLGYAAGFGGGKLLRLPGGMRRALTLEVGMQNAGLGTVLVREMFPDLKQAAMATAAYTFGCMLTGTILAQIWSRREPEDP